MRALTLVVVMCLGCASAPRPAPAQRAPAEPAPGAAPVTAPASTPLADAAGCLTLRDAELGCTRSCGSLSSALSGCAGHAPGAQGRVVVDWRRDGTSPVRYRIRAEGELMMPVTACVDRVFRRFEPCQEGDARGSVPLVIAPGRAP